MLSRWKYILCHIETLKLECFGAKIVDLGVIDLQIEFGTVKVNETTQD